MGKARPPVEHYTNCFPNYISYLPYCSDYSSPPPQGSCSKHITQLTDDEIAHLTETFITLYPAFGHIQNLVVHMHQVTCLYPAYTCVGNECEKARFFLFLAHYLTLVEDPASDNPSAVSSSSVGDVSISYDTSNNSNRSPFFLWLNKTPYGRQLINVITMQGLPFVV